MLLWIIIICQYLKLDSRFHFASKTTVLVVFFLKLTKHQQLKAQLQDSCEELLAEFVFCSSTGTWKSKGGWQLHFSVRTPGKELLLSNKVSFLFSPGLFWMKSKFCSFTLCVRPTLTFRLYLCEKCRKKGCSPLVEGTSNGLTTRWHLYRAIFSCAGLKCISPNCILNISKSARVLKISEHLKKKISEIYFISNEADHF